jgi:paraquat-inducible protein B
MSIHANPTSIGLFTIGAVILGLIGITMLASTTWFTKQTKFTSFFSESVNGLEIGAPVKFQGVPVGRVTNLLIQIESRDKTFQVPVEYEVDLSRLKSFGGAFVDLDDPEVLREQIIDGLRAQLQMESMVTGQLYIELAYMSVPAIAELETRPTRFPEIPTTPSLLAAFGTQAGSMVGDVLRILFRVNEMLEAVNMEELNRSVVSSAQAVERLAESPSIRGAFEQIPTMTAQFNRTMGEMELLAERLSGSVGPLREHMDATNAEVVLTLQSMRLAMDATQGMLSTDSGVGYEMTEAFSSMKDAADALRLLSLALERNPDMLLRGKKTPTN